MSDDLLDVDFSGNKLGLLIPCYTGQVPVEFVNSLLRAMVILKKLGVETRIYWEQGNALVQSARNLLVHRALEDGCTKLMFLDSDIVFTDEDLMRILGFSTKYPIVGATYPGRKYPPTYVVGLPDELTRESLTFNEHGLLKIKGMGFGFVCISAEVFNALKTIVPVYKDEKRDVKNLYSFFAVGISDGVLVGEDIFFFKKAAELGYDVWLDTSVDLGHVGQHVFKHCFRDVLKEKINA